MRREGLTSPGCETRTEGGSEFHQSCLTIHRELVRNLEIVASFGVMQAQWEWNPNPRPVVWFQGIHCSVMDSRTLVW